MKNWPAAFTNELQRTTGLTPIWILRLVVNGVTYDISDTAYTFPASMTNGFTTTKAWVSEWGQVRDSISGSLGEMQISDFSCSLLVDQTAADNIRHLALNHPLEQSPAELYLWLDGLTNATAPQKLFVGYVKDIDLPDETQVHITIEDESTRLQKYIGTRISSEAYPLCDPDDVGKLIPIVYGTVSKLPARCVDSGWVSTLGAGIDFAATSITVSELSTHPMINKRITIDEEEMLISGITGKIFTVIRGQNGTTPQVHTKGSKVIEKRSASEPLVYLVADHPVNSIGTILARVQNVNVDITADCLKYISGTSIYVNKALFTIPDIAKVANKVQIALNDSLAISDAFHTHTTGATAINTPYTDGIAQALPINGSIASSSVPILAVTNINANLYSVCVASFNASATINSSIITISCSCNLALWQVYLSDNANIWAASAKVVKIFDNLVSRIPFSKYSSINNYKATISGASDMQLKYVHLAYNFKDPNMPFGYNYPITGSITVLSRSITSTSGGVGTTGSASMVGRTGSISLSGNSVADIMVGDQILADVTRNITAPSDVISNLLSTYCSDSTLVTVGTFPATYAINGAITEYKKAIEWLDYLSFQCRAFYRKMAGVSRLIVRSPDPTVDGIIPACCLTSEGIKALSYKKAPITDVINKVKVLYSRDWSNPGKQSESYMNAIATTDDASIVIFGEQEQPSLFMFDFVTGSSMANDLATFYCDFYADRKWRISFSTFLDQAKYEFGDIAELSFATDLVGQLVEAGIEPGSLNKIDTMNFIIETAIIPELDAMALTTLLGDQLMTKTRERIVYI